MYTLNNRCIPNIYKNQTVDKDAIVISTTNCIYSIMLINPDLIILYDTYKKTDGKTTIKVTKSNLLRMNILKDRYKASSKDRLLSIALDTLEEKYPHHFRYT